MLRGAVRTPWHLSDDSGDATWRDLLLTHVGASAVQTLRVQTPGGGGGGGIRIRARADMHQQADVCSWLDMFAFDRL